MSLKTTFKFDDSLMLEWECAGIKPLIESIAFLHELPRTCPVPISDDTECGAPLRFFFRSPQGNSYYGLICQGSPAHECNFGQHKEGGTLYYKGDGEFQIAFKDRKGGEGNAPAPAQPGSAAPAASAPAPVTPTGDKAPMEKLNMIGAVARAKKVGDVDGTCKTMFNKPVSELGAAEADAFLDFLKTL